MTNSENIDEEKKAELLDKQQRTLDAFHEAYSYDSFIKAIKNGKMTPEVVRRSACRVLRMMLNANTPVLIKEE